MGKETFRSDGNAIDVVATKRYNKGDVSYDGGYFGIAMGEASSGEDVVLDISEREFVFPVPSDITAVKGDVIYINVTTGALTNTDTDKPFAKITQTKDANNYAWGKLLPQYTDT